MKAANGTFVLNPKSDTPLHEAESLILLGDDTHLDEFESLITKS